MSQQQSRKKLLSEPDEFISTSQHVWNWVGEHRTRAAAITGGVVAAILVAVVVKALVERSHRARSEAVSAAVARYGKATGAVPPELLPEFSRLAAKYRGAPEGKVARFFEAGALAAGGDIDKARGAYGELSGAAAGDLAPLAGVALAYLDLAQGRDEAALAAFRSLLAGKDAALPRAQILLEIAALQEKRGKAAEALEAYRELAAAHPDGSWAAEVKERIRVLAARGPAAS